MTSADAVIAFIPPNDSNEVFESLKRRAKELISKYKVSTEATLFGAVVNNRSPEVAFNIGDATNMPDTITSIDALVYEGGNNNNIKETLDLAESLFTSKNIVRTVDSKLLIVYFGDSVNELEEKIYNKLEQLKKDGIRLQLFLSGNTTEDIKQRLDELVKKSGKQIQ